MRIQGRFDLEVPFGFGTRVRETYHGLGTVRELDLTWQGHDVVLLGVTVEFDDGTQENYAPDELDHLLEVASE